MADPEKADVNKPILDKAQQLNNVWPETATKAPQDRYSAVYLIFYLLGLATLLPWNFFITAQEYWMYRFRDLNSTSYNASDRTPLQTSFTSSVSVAAMVPNTICLMLNTILSKRIPLRLRLVVTLVTVIVLFVVTVVLVKIDTDSWQMGFYGFTLFTVVLLNCNTAVFQGALFGAGGLFPQQITQAIMNGQALGGIFASVVNILSLLGGSSPTDSAFGFFITATITTVFALVAYLNLYRFEFYSYYLVQQTQNGKDQGTELSPTTNRSKNVPLWQVFKKIKVYAISVCLVFMVTLSIFPAVTALVVSMHYEDGSEWNKKYFNPVGCFLIYNIGDYVGRMAAGWHDLPKTRIPLLPILCVIRVVFIPLFIFCNIKPPRYVTSTVFKHDAYFLLFMSLMSLSGGYLASQAMIHGPKQAEAELQEPAGAMMAFFLGLGLMLGSILSNGFVKLL